MGLPQYDLHCHSSASDGVLSPAELVEKAQGRGIEILALTDHDTLSGVKDVMSFQSETFRIIPAAEFTCQWHGRILHIVGLGLDLESVDLSSYLQVIEQLRIQRAKEIARRLIKMGLPDLYPDAEEMAAGGSIGRPHFARAMVEKNISCNEQQAFKKYLGAGKKGDVKVDWPEMDRTIAAINNSSGLAVFAHPTKYKMTFTKIREIVREFVVHGGAGIEVSYPGITKDQQKHLINIAEKNGLLVSAGSDFHSPQHGWTDLGKFMPVPDLDNHILERFL